MRCGDKEEQVLNEQRQEGLKLCREGPDGSEECVEFDKQVQGMACRNNARTGLLQAPNINSYFAACVLFYIIIAIHVAMQSILLPVVLGDLARKNKLSCMPGLCPIPT